MSDAGLPSWLRHSGFVPAGRGDEWEAFALTPGQSAPLDALVERIGGLLDAIDPWAGLDEPAPGLTPEQRRALGG